MTSRKAYLHSEQRAIREAVLWNVDGLGEYDIRRPLTATGTNLLGLVKTCRSGRPGTSARSSGGRSRTLAPLG
jgi:hypothetical protein